MRMALFEERFAEQCMLWGRGPWTVGGDWNREPGEQSAFTDYLEAVAYAPESPTRWCGRRTIDRFLCKNVMPSNVAADDELTLGDHRE